jgi:hypothetical protein
VSRCRSHKRYDRAVSRLSAAIPHTASHRNRELCPALSLNRADVVLGKARRAV